MKEIKKFIKNNYIFIIVYIILLCLIFIKLDYEIYTPGGLLDLNDKIEIKDSYKSKGSFNLTYVGGFNANILFVLASYVIPSWDLIKTEDIRYEDETEEEAIERNKVYLSDVNKYAVYVAFKKLSYDVSLEEKGVIVLNVLPQAETDLKVGDIITSINNIKVKNNDELINIVSSLKKDQRVTFNVIRKNKNRECYAVLKENEGSTIVGILIEPEVELKSNPEVKFKFKKNELGPSGGFMTALKIYDMLTEEDITKGYKISGTGTIDEKGRAGEIGGIKYKLAGAVKKKSQIFICPSDNYDECEDEKVKNNYNIMLIKGDTFDNVLNKLNALPYYDK